MKIKNSVDKLDTRILPAVFFFAALVSTVIRTLQVFRFIEHETGFITGGGWLMTILYVIVFGCGLAFCVASYLSKDTASHQPQGLKDKLAGGFAFAFSVTLAGDWISSFFNFITSLTTDVSVPGFRGFMSSGVITYLAQSFLAFFSAIYFVIFALDLLRGTVKANKAKILALAPVGWAGIRLIHRFIRQISFVEVSDLLFELIMLSCAVLFFMQGSNPSLLQCRWILYQLSHKGSPRILEWVAFPFSSRSSQPRNQTQVSCISGRFFTN